jgi:hypothetical protein
VPVTPATQKAILGHLAAGAFELRVAAGFENLKDTPALASLQAAVAQVASARAWVQEHLAVEAPAMKPTRPPIGEGLPLTRKQRVGYRWL